MAGLCVPFNTADNPLEYAHVFAKARPDVLAIAAFAKPIYAIQFWRAARLRSDLDPMREIVGHVVAAEGEHGEWIAPYHADLADLVSEMSDPGSWLWLEKQRKSTITRSAPVEREWVR